MTGTRGVGTFRDPAGSVEIRPDAVYRIIHPPHGTEMLEFLATPLARTLEAEGRLIGSEVLERGEGGGDVLLRHPKVEFTSYPWEWAPALWLAAAELTLELGRDLLVEGWILKDATPLNVLFQGTRPVFVDVLSVAKVDATKPIWYAYGQFIRTFLLPMIAYAELGWPLTMTMARRDGYEPEELFAVLPLSARVRQPALSAITLPRLLAGSGSLGAKAAGAAAASASGKASDPELVRHILGETFANLLTQMRRATPVPKASTWTEYSGTATHYEATDHASKKEFVAEALREMKPVRALDVGCNSGVYSELAEAAGASVVAVDTDLQTIDQLYGRLGKSGRRILPMVMSLAQPSPGVGWENAESRSFLERCAGQFDTVLMLAVIHHLLLHDQIPLDRIAPFCARLTTRNLIMEWVPPTDVKFQELVRGREAVFARVTEAAFRAEFGRYFTVVREHTLRNGRILFWLQAAAAEPAA